MNDRRITGRGFLAAWAPLALAACAGGGEGGGETEPAPAPLDEAAVAARSAPIAQGFAADLRTQLKSALETGGAKNAVSVCQQVAPALAESASEESGARVTRIAALHRNPQGGVPPEMQAQYDSLAAEPVVDGAPARRIWQAEDGRVHFLSAIPMAEQPCSACHGPAIDPELKAHIESLYPDDAATGFEPGDLRGALLISWPAGSFGA
ncbi:MAG: c-type heme family protein [Erythrobacter sp.]